MKWIFSAIIFLSFLTSKAQEKADTTELLPVEVKAIRASATAPFAKTNLSRSEISRQNLGQDLPFLLNQTPSVVVNSDAGNGVGYTGIRIRGTDATRINVTLNGIPYNDAESQGTFFVDLPDFASSVSSIQVQRGVGTSTNGAGSFGASINLSTNELNPEAYAELNNSLGSFSTWKNTIRAGTGLLGDHFTTDVRLSRITSDGYIDRASSRLSALYFSTAYVSEKTNLRLNVFSGKEKTYQAWYGVSGADLESNRRINYAGMEKPDSPYDNETDNYDQDHYQFFFNQQLAPKLVFSTGVFLVKGRGFYEQYKAGQEYAQYGLPNRASGTITESDLVRQLWLDNDYYGDVFSFHHQSGPTQLIVGGAITRYQGKHFGEITWAKEGLDQPTHRWYDLDADKKDLNFYAKWDQELSGAFRVFADAQFRSVNYELNGFRNNPTLQIDQNYRFFNPKIGVSYHKLNWRAYASYSRASKEPNRDDFEAGMQQQPLPEQLNDFELGFEHKKDQASWGANIYYMQYTDQLVLTGKINDVGAYTRTNIPDSYRLGVELQASAKLRPWLQAAANLTLSRNRIQDFTEFVDDYDNGGQLAYAYGETDIAYSPSVTGGATITVSPVKPVQLVFLSKYVSDQFLDNTSNKDRKLDAFFTQDLRASYSFNYRWLKNASLIIQANNLFDKKYEPNGYTYSYFYNAKLTTENYYFPMAGRNWMVGVNVRF
jgi:iron complex outermembrane receptor protein